MIFTGHLSPTPVENNLRRILDVSLVSQQFLATLDLMQLKLVT